MSALTLPRGAHARATSAMLAHVTCPICLEPFTDAHCVATCGHTFCHGCASAELDGRTLPTRRRLALALGASLLAARDAWTPLKVVGVAVKRGKLTHRPAARRVADLPREVRRVPRATVPRFCALVLLAAFLTPGLGQLCVARPPGWIIASAEAPASIPK